MRRSIFPICPSTTRQQLPRQTAAASGAATPGSLDPFPFTHRSLWVPSPWCNTHAGSRVPLGHEWQLGRSLFGMPVRIFPRVFVDRQINVYLLSCRAFGPKYREYVHGMCAQPVTTKSQTSTYSCTSLPCRVSASKRGPSRSESPRPVPEEQPRRLQGDTAESSAPARSPKAVQAHDCAHNLVLCSQCTQSAVGALWCVHCSVVHSRVICVRRALRLAFIHSFKRLTHARAARALTVRRETRHTRVAQPSASKPWSAHLVSFPPPHWCPRFRCCAFSVDVDAHGTWCTLFSVPILYVMCFSSSSSSSPAPRIPSCLYCSYVRSSSWRYLALIARFPRCTQSLNPSLTWLFEHLKCAYTVEDISVSVLPATDNFGELNYELFFAWCYVFSRMCCIGHSTSALPHSVGAAARVFVPRNISLFAVNASVARKYFSVVPASAFAFEKAAVSTSPAADILEEVELRRFFFTWFLV